MRRETIEITIGDDGTLGVDHRSGTDALCLKTLDVLLAGLGTEVRRDVRPEGRRRATATTTVKGGRR